MVPASAARRQEVSKAPSRSIEGVTDKCEIPRAERPDNRRIIAACLFEEGHQQQGSRVVVQAVSIVVARDVEDGVLKQPVSSVIDRRGSRCSSGKPAERAASVWARKASPAVRVLGSSA